jgi:hypothetical protein
MKARGRLAVEVIRQKDGYNRGYGGGRYQQPQRNAIAGQSWSGHC